MGRLIDADALIESMRFQDGINEDGVVYVRLGDIRKSIAEQPEAVVRCRDCKYVERARSKEAARKFGQIYICGRHVFLSPKPDDYCSWAERKTNE